MDRVCELVRMRGLDRVFELKHALERRGIEAQVWGDGTLGVRRSAGVLRDLRLVVWERDVIYARWVLHGQGLDTWPDADDEAGQGGPSDC